MESLIFRPMPLLGKNRSSLKSSLSSLSVKSLRSLKFLPSGSKGLSFMNSLSSLSLSGLPLVSGIPRTSCVPVIKAVNEDGIFSPGPGFYMTSDWNEALTYMSVLIDGATRIEVKVLLPEKRSYLVMRVVKPFYDSFSKDVDALVKMLFEKGSESEVFIYFYYPKELNRHKMTVWYYTAIDLKPSVTHRKI